jgi:hypothetical protein
MDEFTPEGMTVIEHVSDAWRLLLQLPGAEHGRVSDYLGGHYDWSEVEGDETAMWRASLSSTRRTMAARSATSSRTTGHCSLRHAVTGDCG